MSFLWIPFISNRTLRCFLMASTVSSTCSKRFPLIIIVSTISIDVLNLPTLAFAEIKNLCGFFPNSKMAAFVKILSSVVSSRLENIFSNESSFDMLGILFLARFLKFSMVEVFTSERLALQGILSQVFPIFFNKNRDNSLPLSSCVVLPLLI